MGSTIVAKETRAGDPFVVAGKGKQARDAARLYRGRRLPLLRRGRRGIPLPRPLPEVPELMAPRWYWAFVANLFTGMLATVLFACAFYGV
jgi:hypothetical protein